MLDLDLKDLPDVATRMQARLARRGRLGDVRAGRRFQASLPTGAVQLTVRLAPVDAGPLCLARMTLFYSFVGAAVQRAASR